MTHDLPKALTIVCQFSCYLCDVTNMPVVCEVRRPDEDVIAFMNRTVEHVARVHRMVHPHCENTKLDELKVPLPASAPRIGDPETH